MDNSITFNCPHCTQAYRVTPDQAAEYAGQTITCTACRQPFVVPAQIGQPAAPPYPQPPPFTQPQPVQPINYAGMAQGRQTSGIAIASLVCGCFLCIPILPGLLATIFGAIGMKATKDGQVGGRGLAIAGLILGVLNLLAWIAYFAIFAVLFSAGYKAARTASTQIVCQSHLQRIGLDLQMYAAQNNGQYPPGLSPLITAGPATPSDFICPFTSDTPAPGATRQQQAANLTSGGHLSYVYLGANLSTRSPSGAVLAYDPPSHHGVTGTPFLFRDGHTAWIDQQTAQKAVAELNRGQNPPPSLAGR